MEKLITLWVSWHITNNLYFLILPPSSAAQLPDLACYLQKLSKSAQMFHPTDWKPDSGYRKTAWLIGSKLVYCNMKLRHHVMWKEERTGSTPSLVQRTRSRKRSVPQQKKLLRKCLCLNHILTPTMLLYCKCVRGHHDSGMVRSHKLYILTLREGLYYNCPILWWKIVQTGS